jgi:hypothetical protein
LKAYEKRDFSFEENNNFLFRSNLESGYVSFNKLFHIIELITLDYSNNCFSPLKLCLSVMYLMLLKKLTNDDGTLYANISNDNNYIVNFHDFNKYFFFIFLPKICQYDFNSMYESIIYCVRYFIVEEESYLIEGRYRKFISLEDRFQTQNHNERLLTYYKRVCPQYEGPLK